MHNKGFTLPDVVYYKSQIVMYMSIFYIIVVGSYVPFLIFISQSSLYNYAYLSIMAIWFLILYIFTKESDKEYLLVKKKCLKCKWSSASCIDDFNRIVDHCENATSEMYNQYPFGYGCNDFEENK